MYEYRCAMCGELMTAERKQNARRFCGKKCYGQFQRLKTKEKTEMQTIPDLPPLTEMTDEGFVQLVKAMVAQSRSDILTHSPETCCRKDAENFLVSDYFFALTGMDGFEMLCKWQDEYDEKQRKKEARRRT